MTDQATTKQGAGKIGVYPYYVLGVLILISILNYYDRNVISIALQAMKVELKLSDTQAGLLSGLAFVAVYSLIGLPLARYADRRRRVRVLSAALAVWSVMTAACGFATNFATMFAARMGVGVGEAGGLPSTHALVAEYFPPERRASALSSIAVAGLLGIGLATFVGGPVVTHYGWRAAFWIGSGPGVVLALLAFLTIREPGRTKTREAAPNAVPLGTALRMLARRPSFALVTIGMMVAGIGAYAQLAWGPTFYIRTFHKTAAEIGPIYGLISFVPALLGMLLGGVVMDRWIRKDKRALVWILILTYAVSIPFGLVTYLAPTFKISLAGALITSLVGSIYVGPNYALIQGLAGPKLRAFAASIYMVVINLIGLGLGPVVAGVVSDRLTHTFGADSLRWSLCLTLVTFVVSLIFFGLAARTVRADLEDAERS